MVLLVPSYSSNFGEEHENKKVIDSKKNLPCPLQTRLIKMLFSSDSWFQNLVVAAKLSTLILSGLCAATIHLNAQYCTVSQLSN